MGIKSKSYSFLLLLVLKSFSGLLFSQNRSETGFIVLQTNDTINGTIKRTHWFLNPRSIEFIRENSFDSEYLFPHDIKSFSISGELFLSAVVDIEISPIDIDELGYSSNFILSRDTVFLQVLLKGEKSLLYLKTKDRREHFYLEGLDGFELLKHKKYFKDISNNRVTLSNNEYKNRLLAYFNQCPEITKSISTDRINF